MEEWAEFWKDLVAACAVLWSGEALCQTGSRTTTRAAAISQPSVEAHDRQQPTHEL
jgi:hypothetical protein